MARISMEEFQQIKAAYLHPYMGRFNDLWDKRMLQLFDTIEAQQQEIEQKNKVLEQAKNALNNFIYTIQELDKETDIFDTSVVMAIETLAEINIISTLSNTNQSVSREE